MREFFEQTLRHLKAGERVVWCVILETRGSTPRSAGAKMAVFADGTSYGTVGGGAVEHQAALFAGTLGRLGGVRSFDLYGYGSQSIGMVCGGSVTLGFLPLPPEAAERVEDFLRVLDRPDEQWLSLSVSENGDFGFGTVCAQDENTLLPELSDVPSVEKGPDGQWRILEPLFPHGRVWIFGAGHVSAALTPVLLRLSFPVTVIDPRPELARAERFPGAAVLCADYEPLPEAVTISERDFVVVLTSGHEKDLAVLRQVLNSPVSYIGCIGSRKKTAYVNQVLASEGFPPAELARIHAPIGLPILAKTPEEIAISIAAELILHRAGG